MAEGGDDRSLSEEGESECDEGRVESSETSDVEEYPSSESSSEDLPNAEGDSQPLTMKTEQLEGHSSGQLELPPTDLDGGLEHGTQMDSIYSNSSPESGVEHKKKLLVPKDEDEVVEHVAATCVRDQQRQIDLLQEQLQQSEKEIRQLQAELGGRQFLEERNKRRAKQSKSYTASGTYHAFTGVEGNLHSRTGPLQEPSFAQILQEISNSMSEDELKKMKFLVRPQVNAFRLARIRDGFELFKELETIGKLSLTFVKQLLEGIQRFDLAERVVGVALPDTAETGFALQRRLLEISNSLLEPEIQQLKFLARPKVNVIRLRKIREGYELFEELETNRELSCVYVRELLEGIQRYDLAERVGVGVALPDTAETGREENDDPPAESESSAEENNPCLDSSDGGPCTAERSSEVCSGIQPVTEHRQVVERDLATVDQSVAVSDKSTQTDEWEPLGARPRDQPAVQREPLPGASYMDHMMHDMESNRAEPCMIDCQASKRAANERGSLRFHPPAPEERCNAEDGSGGHLPTSTPWNGSQPSARSTVNLVPHVNTENSDLPSLHSVRGSNAANSGFLSGETSSRTSQHSLQTPGSNLSSNTADPIPFQAATQPGCTESEVPSHNSEVSSLDSSRVSTQTVDGAMNSALLTLAQRIQEACANVEREREEWRREGEEYDNLQHQGPDVNATLPCIAPAESLDGINSSVPAVQRRLARARAIARRERAGREVANRRWCNCQHQHGEIEPICRNCLKLRYLGPSSHSDHEECCFCQQDVLSGGSCRILPCLHRVHTECVVDMIHNGMFDCPICGHTFLPALQAYIEA